MDPSLFDVEKCYQLVGKELPLQNRLLANMNHVKLLFVLSYVYHNDYNQTKMLKIYNTFFGRDITDVLLLNYGFKWDKLQTYYPELDLPPLGDGEETVDGKRRSTYYKFVEIRNKLLELVPELEQYVA